MAVRETERRFDPQIGAEIITLEDSFGRQHKLTVYLLGDAETCPSCGQVIPRPVPQGGTGLRPAPHQTVRGPAQVGDHLGVHRTVHPEVDVDAIVAQVKHVMEEQEARLRAHIEKRGPVPPCGTGRGSEVSGDSRLGETASDRGPVA